MSWQPYTSDHPTRAVVDAMSGSVVIEFGVDWCPHCQQAAGPVADALAGAAGATGTAGASTDGSIAAATGPLQHFRLEDERARPLGRSFRVKLWPTLVFLQDGVEVARVVRPTTVAEVMAGLEQLGSNKEVRP